MLHLPWLSAGASSWSYSCSDAPCQAPPTPQACDQQCPTSVVPLPLPCSNSPAASPAPCTDILSLHLAPASRLSLMGPSNPAPCRIRSEHCILLDQKVECNPLAHSTLWVFPWSDAMLGTPGRALLWDGHPTSQITGDVSERNTVGPMHELRRCTITHFLRPGSKHQPPGVVADESKGKRCLLVMERLLCCGLALPWDAVPPSCSFGEGHP